MKLLLVRHGETFANEQHIMQGQTPGELNPTGIAQAQLLRDKLAQTHIDLFVSSDLKRAFDTCKIIAEPHKKQVITTPLLRERDWGSFTGRYIPDLKDEVWPEDIESLDALKARATAFLAWLRTLTSQQIEENTTEISEETSNLKPQTSNLIVLAVGHGIINKAIQSVYFDKPMNEIVKMSNTEMRILNYEF